MQVFTDKKGEGMMKRRSKISAVLMAICLVLTALLPQFTVLAADYSDNPDAAYFGTGLQRYKCPDYSNPFYFSKLNIFQATGWGMPNCTAYAWGRAYEYYQVKPQLSTYNAGEWWFDNISWKAYEFGQEPRVGSVAVWDRWDQNRGHVAFVEAVEGDHIILSESSYGGTMFRVRTIKSDSSDYLYGGDLRFLGFIYVDKPYQGASKLPGQQWRLYESVVARFTPSVTGKSWLTVKSGAELNITETVQAEGYLWGKFTYAGTTAWCVLNYATCLTDTTQTPDPPTEPVEGEEIRVINSTVGVNLRSGPGTKYSKIGRAHV